MATAVKVAAAVKQFIDDQWGDPSRPGIFDRMSGLVLTGDEAIRSHADLYWTSDTLALSMVMEGMADWPGEAAAALQSCFPEWKLLPVNSYTLGMLPPLRREFHTTQTAWLSLLVSPMTRSERGVPATHKPTRNQLGTVKHGDPRQPVVYELIRKVPGQDHKRLPVARTGHQ